jgi:hypothetical protein
LRQQVRFVLGLDLSFIVALNLDILCALIDARGSLVTKAELMARVWPGIAEARVAIEKMRQLDPDLRISDLQDRLPFRRPDDLARYSEGLRIAGLPE